MIVTIANQKGGVCKSSTAVSLASELQRRGYKILLIDTDPQGNLSFSVRSKQDITISNVLTNSLSKKEQKDIQIVPITAIEAIQKTPEGFMIIPSDPSVSGFQESEPDLLTKALKPIRNAFDVVIIDTPPTLSGITINAIRAADLIIIPATPSVSSLQGIRQLHNLIGLVNPDVKIAGILLTKYSDRSIINRQLKETAADLAAEIGTKVFDTYIRQTVAMEESYAMQTPIMKYAPKSTAAEDYSAFAEEFIRKELL